MADNYLEKRYEEIFGAGASTHTPKRGGPSLNTLLVKNRSTRRFRTDAEVSIEHLRTIVEVNTRIASAMNRQTLRFGIVKKDDAPADGNSPYERFCELYVHGQDWRVPPFAFIVVFSTLPEGRFVDIDLGISLQSMALKAVELGYNCLMIGRNTPEELAGAYSAGDPDRSAAIADLHPLVFLAVGKSGESAFLKPVSFADAPLDESGKPAPGYLAYYEKDGVRYVPKLVLDDILL
ncbi:MAG: nitroreductase family protein [Candidatus Cryptobacteroides sp.]